MEAYNICKFFKSIYTQLNFAPIIYFKDNKMIFETNSPFYINSGELLIQNDFTNWLNNKILSISTADITELGKVLKKNTLETSLNENEMSVKFLTKDGIEKIITFSNLEDNNKTIVLNKFEKLDNYRNHLTVEKTLPSEYFNDDILELFLNENNEISLERTSKKLVEVPTDKIEQTKGGDYKIKFSEQTTNGQRYIEITSKNDDLELSQLFATI